MQSPHGALCYNSLVGQQSGAGLDLTPLGHGLQISMPPESRVAHLQLCTFLSTQGDKGVTIMGYYLSLFVL